MKLAALVLAAMVACDHTSGSGDTPRPDGDADASADASLTDAAPGVDAPATDAAPSDAASAADAGEGTPLPQVTCTEAAQCGEAGVCVDATCVCRSGLRECAGGCCLGPTLTASVPGLAGPHAQLEIDHEGVAWLVVLDGQDPQHARLWRRPPGGTFAKDPDFAVRVSEGGDAFDFAVTKDGTLVMAHATTRDEWSPLQLSRFRPGAPPTSATLGETYGPDGGVGLALATDDTIWVSWGEPGAGTLHWARVGPDGETTTGQHVTDGLVQESDVVIDAAGQAVAYWANWFRGSRTWGVRGLGDAPAPPDGCPGPVLRPTQDGHHWSMYNTYPAGETILCRDGNSAFITTPAAAQAVLAWWWRPGIVVDGEGTLYVFAYEPSLRQASWATTRDLTRLGHGTINTPYPEVPSPRQAPLVGATTPHGRVVLALVPELSSMGPALILEF